LWKKKGNEVNEKKIIIDYSDWVTEAFKRYPDKNVTFVCPVCKYRQSIRDLEEAGLERGTWGFSCIGRGLDKCKRAFGDGKEKSGPCDYAGGGLFRLNPISVKFEDGTISDFFDFADDPLCPPKIQQ
jgi:hypothetical protein